MTKITEADVSNVETSPFDQLVADIKAYTTLGQNVCLVGKHGVGKTAAVLEACKQAGLTLWYKSAPLMDPDIDFGGVPIPNKETKSLEFYTAPELLEAEVIFMDELNRASPRVLNMLFEIVQFKSINGKKLKKLKAVHTGINPPGGGQYDVQTLDDALVDRFHAFIDVAPAYPDVVMLQYLTAAENNVFKTWWTSQLTGKGVYVSPRRLVYAAEAYKANMPLERAFTDAKVPVGRLREALAAVRLTTANVTQAKPAGPPPVWMEEKFQKKDTTLNR